MVCVEASLESLKAGKHPMPAAAVTAALPCTRYPDLQSALPLRPLHGACEISFEGCAQQVLRRPCL